VLTMLDPNEKLQPYQRRRAYERILPIPEAFDK